MCGVGSSGSGGQLSRAVFSHLHGSGGGQRDWSAFRLVAPCWRRGVIGPSAIVSRRPAAAVCRPWRVRWCRLRRSHAGLAGWRGGLAVAWRCRIGVGRVAGPQALGQQDLDPGGDRYRHEGADQPESGATDQAGQQHSAGAELNRPAHDPRCYQVVLKLLVEHEECGHQHCDGPQVGRPRVRASRRQRCLRASPRLRFRIGSYPVGKTVLCVGQWIAILLVSRTPSRARLRPAACAALVRPFSRSRRSWSCWSR